MAILVSSGSPLGLRALASGGRTAFSSYEQIARTVRQSLGPEHAALFCEPSVRAGSLDWFTNFEADARPLRFTDAPLAQREECRAKLERLVRDIEAKAVTLQKSDRQDERILGDMLAFAVEVPDESALFIIGAQPVLTFWGHVRDQGRPVENPLHTLMRRGPPAAEPAGGVISAPASSAAPALPQDASSHPKLIATALWAAFVALLLAIGIMLLRACALGLPASLTGWFLNYCSATADSGLLAAIAAEQTKQSILQAEYDELIRQAELKKQACIVPKRPAPPAPPPPPPPPAPPPPPPPHPPVLPSPPPAPPPAPPSPPDQRLQIPEQPSKDDKRFLEGCWAAHPGLTEYHDGVSTGLTLSVMFCFDKNGSGYQQIRYDKDGAVCRANARARWQNDSIVIDFDSAACNLGHSSFKAGTVVCRRDANGDAVCDETSVGETKPDFKDFPFIKVPSKP